MHSLFSLYVPVAWTGSDEQAEAVGKVAYALTRALGGYSRATVLGAWRDPKSGDEVSDWSYRYDVITTDPIAREIMECVARAVKRELGQDTVLLTEQPIRADYV